MGYGDSPAPAAVALAKRRCPALPPDARFAWVEYSEEADYEVCLAAAPGRPLRIGVYWGNWPAFNPRAGVAIGPGIVAGRPITWYQKGFVAADGLVGRQTLITLNEAIQFSAHVWMYAGSDRELQDELVFVKTMAITPPCGLPFEPTGVPPALRPLP